MKSTIVIFISILGILSSVLGQTLTETQMRNARATGYAIVASRNPGKSFSIYVVQWDGVNTLEYNANTQINAGWHAQAAIKGNYFYQSFDNSDFSQYSSVVLSQAEFDQYKSTGTHWWIVCSTLSPFSNSSINMAQNGYVGIGTAAPSSNLHIANTNGEGIRIGAINDAGSTAVAMGAQTLQYNLDFSGYRDIAPDQIGARIAALRFNNYQNNFAGYQNTGMAFYTNPSGFNSGTTDLQERLRITPLGNIGIGTTSPTSKLQVNGNGAGTTALSIIENSNSANGAHFVSEGANNIMFQLKRTADGIANTELRTGGNSYLNAISGNVGIGTTNPQQKLHVKGTVYSTEVRVDVAAGTGPDYVFEKDYKLPSLEEIKTYIDRHKHLPEVPSAKEMEENGVNLGEMNLMLLKKIEELTLYFIQKDNQIKILQNQINEIKSKE